MEQMCFLLVSPAVQVKTPEVTEATGAWRHILKLYSEVWVDQDVCLHVSDTGWWRTLSHINPHFILASPPPLLTNLFLVPPWSVSTSRVDRLCHHKQRKTQHSCAHIYISQPPSEYMCVTHSWTSYTTSWNMQSFCLCVLKTLRKVMQLHHRIIESSARVYFCRGNTLSTYEGRNPVISVRISPPGAFCSV